MKARGPQKEGGFVQIANELAAAISLAGFNFGESVVVNEIIGRIYGFEKANAATISPCALARAVGMDKSNLIRSIRGLLSGNVITKVGDNQYGLNKHYREWMTPLGLPRIAGCRIAYCESKIRPNASTNGGGQNDTSAGVSTDTSAGVSTDTKWCQHGHQMVSPLTPNGVTTDTNAAFPPGPPIEERVCAEEKKEERTYVRSESILPMKPAARTQTEIYLSGKSEAERAWFAEAIAELGKRDDTRHLVGGIEMYADTPNVRDLACWQILQATRVILNPGRDKTWNMFIGCARRATWAEFETSTRRIEAAKRAASAPEAEPYVPACERPGYVKMRMNPDILSKPRPGRRAI